MFPRTDQEVFGFGFVFFVLIFINRPKLTDVSVKNRKTDRPHFHFRFTTMGACDSGVTVFGAYVETTGTFGLGDIS